jgi:manganese oxidase
MRSRLRPVTGAALAVVLMVGIVHTARLSEQRQVGGKPTAISERIVANDNRTPAGTIANNTLTVRLEARFGEWHPDGDANPGVAVKAFAADGGTLQVPGPLIRVKQRTTVRASVSNTTSEPLAVHGLYSRSGTNLDVMAPLVVAPGETREVTFIAFTPGMYYYWGSTDAKTALEQRPGPDTQLTGALVVDPPDSTAPDRVIVLSTYADDRPLGSPERVIRYAMNGMSWPHTERLTYNVDDTVRMRLANVSSATHPMHLHGFYFKVDTRLVRLSF